MSAPSGRTAPVITSTQPVAGGERQGPDAGRLQPADAEPARPLPPAFVADGVPVQGHPIERGQVAVRHQLLPQHAAVRLGDRAVLGGQRAHGGEDLLLGLGDG